MELFYNPERMSETEIKETFVAHQWLVDEIVSILKRQPKGAGVQHAIIVAPRGMGKTTLLLMLRFRVLESDLSKSWQPLLFPEESYDIYELADFWLAVLRHLSDETGDASIAQELSDLKDRYRNNRHLEEAALARIKDWQKKNKKRLLALVDSFDIILAQINDERDNARLRDVLMNDGALMLIGGATTFFKEARAYEQPLYNLFKIYNLQSLTSDQIHELLRRRARLDGKEDFEEILRVNATRLRVLEYFTGGNPRLVMMLYRVLTHSEISEVRRGLEKLLDEVTPYYKAKIETLPAQQRKILDHIARITAITREGLTPTEIADSTRLSINQVSVQLQRLGEAGYVRAANIRSRSSYYTLSEPLYAIWHQMRFGREARRRMEWLVSFLKSWYDAQELDSECQRLQTIFRQCLTTGRVAEARDVLEHRRYLVSALDGKEHSRTLEEVILSYLELKDIEMVKRELADINPSQLTRETRSRLFAAGLLTQTQVNKLSSDQSVKGSKSAEARANIERAHDALEKNNKIEADRAFRRAIELEPASPVAYVGLALTQMFYGNAGEAIQTLKQYESLFKRNSPVQLTLSALVSAVSRKPKDAALSLNKIKSKSIASSGWFSAGVVFLVSSQFTEALEAFSRVNALNPSYFEGWHQRALVLEQLEKNEDALQSIDRALQIWPDSEQAHLEKARILARLNRHDEALLCLDRSLELNPAATDVWLGRGISLIHLERFSEALASFEKACELEGDSHDTLFLRAILLAILERYQEAIQILDTALTFEPNSFDAHYLRGRMLTSLNNRDEALKSYRRAFAITSGKHRTLADKSDTMSTKLRLSLIDSDFRQAKRDWEKLRESAYKEGGEAFWLETASKLVRESTSLGQEQCEFLHRLVGPSNAEETLFPLARALEYLIEGDETLIEKLSPEMRQIVHEIVDSFKKSSAVSNLKKKQTKPQRKSRLK